MEFEDHDSSFNEMCIAAGLATVHSMDILAPPANKYSIAARQPRW